MNFSKAWAEYSPIYTWTILWVLIWRFMLQWSTITIYGYRGSLCRALRLIPWEQAIWIILKSCTMKLFARWYRNSFVRNSSHILHSHTNSLSLANFVGCVVGFLSVCKIRLRCFLLAASLSFESEMVSFLEKSLAGTAELVYFELEFTKQLKADLTPFDFPDLWFYTLLPANIIGYCFLTVLRN